MILLVPLHKHLLALHTGTIANKIPLKLISVFPINLFARNNRTRTNRTIISMHCAILSKLYCYRHQSKNTNRYLLALLLLLPTLMLTLKIFLKFNTHLYLLRIRVNHSFNILHLAHFLLRVKLLLLLQNVPLLLFIVLLLHQKMLAQLISISPCYYDWHKIKDKKTDLQVQMSLLKKCCHINVNERYQLSIMLIIMMMHKAWMSLRKVVYLIFVEVTTTTLHSSRCHVYANRSHLRSFRHHYRLQPQHSTCKITYEINRGVLSESAKIKRSLQICVRDLLTSNKIMSQKGEEAMMLITTKVI